VPLRVRFAPSPTGFLHVGGARTALFNWLLARREGGAFVLRIEDTDRARSTEEMVAAILEGMEWLGLDWDEGPHFQGRGVERHRSDALRLLEKGLAYRDFTAPGEMARLREEQPERALRHPRERAEALGDEAAEERAAAGEPHAIRLRVPEGETVWDDEVYGRVRFRNADIEDLVLLRSDETPTYNLAVVSDDAAMEITHVIRGDDHLSNTPKQILLHQGLGSRVPAFAHVPMILGPDGKRLSKRHGALAVGEYRKMGILPEAMVNFLALLGWSPGTDEEVMSRDELVERFSLGRVLKKSAVFDLEKLQWLNGRHLSRLGSGELARTVLEAMDEGRDEAERRMREDPEWFHALLDLLKARARTPADIALQARPYVLQELAYDPDAVAKHWEKRPEEVEGHLEALRERLAEASWDEESLEEALRALAEERGAGAGRLIHPLRVALTGQAVSPGIFEVLVMMGRERALSRIGAAAERIRRKLRGNT
jgi:glutamyl-tRNA synthetase